jgi:hypothetical protein
MNVYTVILALEVVQDGPSRIDKFTIEAESPEQAAWTAKDSVLHNLRLHPLDVRIVGTYEGELKNLYWEG